MTLQQTVSVLHLVISLFALLILAFWFWRDYRIDSLRERLFELRQELFDCAAMGVVPFDHPAYTDLRNIMNGMIRFAHKTTFLRLLLAVTADSIFPVPSIKKPYQDWER